MALHTFLATCQARLEDTLSRWLPAADTQPDALHQAMRYAVLDGGKRIRPGLVYASGHALSVPDEALDAAACAIELIHVYSLIHDDLPAMDDDDLRRGKPTCHKAYGEAVAILAGDALQALAFHVLATRPPAQVLPAQRLAMVDILAMASGSRGMAGGQAIDLGAVGHTLSLPELENMHIHKTGALIRASVALGGRCHPEPNPALLTHLDHYAKCIGLAFQIRDDILDVEADTATLGKAQGADQAHNKPTYPALLGLDGAKQMARTLYEEAMGSLDTFGSGADPLRGIAHYIIERGH